MNGRQSSPSSWTNASTRNAFRALLNQTEGVGIPLAAMIQDARTVEDLAHALRRVITFFDGFALEAGDACWRWHDWSAGVDWDEVEWLELAASLMETARDGLPAGRVI